MRTSNLLAVVLAGPALASPLSWQIRQAITPLSTAQIDVFTPYSLYASAAYCNSNTTIDWSCGSLCEGNPDFIPTAAGGDGDNVQFWYVGFDPTLDSVIVAHQGTDPEEILADLTDLDFHLTNLDSSLFPGLSSSIKVHNGFAAEQVLTATSVLSAVQTTLSEHSTSTITVLGHSLGAALALLDSIYLPLNLPDDLNVRTMTYGLPRVGNQAFANYVDEHVSLTHINNKEDPVPILPGMFLGFVHPSGEVHIEDSGEWANCPGQDNPSTECIVGDVPNIFDGEVSDHDGPYNGVTMGC